MPCQVRQGKRQRPGLAFVKNDYPRQGRRGFSFGKDIMETNTFEYIWSLLNPQGEYKRRRQACERLWQGYDDNQQRNIYIRIKAKLRQGDLSNFPEVLPYSHRWHTVLSSSITSEYNSDNGSPSRHISTMLGRSPCDLSNFPEVLPYSHRWHIVLSTSISSE